MAEVVNRVVAEAAGEHVDVLSEKSGCAEHRVVLGDVFDDGCDRIGPIAEGSQGPGHGLIDEAHRATTDQALELHQAKIGLDAGGVAVHEQTDGSGGRKHRRLRIAYTVGLGVLAGLVPRLASGVKNKRRGQLLIDFGRSNPMLVEHTKHRLAVGLEPIKGAHARSEPSGRAVCLPGDERGDAGSDGPPTLAVIGQAKCHQHRPEICVAETELAERLGGLADLRRGVVSIPDEDLLRSKHDPHCVHKAVNVETVDPVGFLAGEERHEVERRQIARRVVEVDVF